MKCSLHCSSPEQWTIRSIRATRNSVLPKRYAQLAGTSRKSDPIIEREPATFVQCRRTHKRCPCNSRFRQSWFLQMNTETETPQSGQVSLLEGTVEVLRWRISDNWRRKVFVQLSAVPLLLLSGFVFYHLARLVGGMSDNPSTNGLLLLVSLLSVIPIHETAHGIVMRHYGGNPRYGFLWKGLVFYSTCPDYAFRRNQYLTITLAPFVGISFLVVSCFALFPGSDWLFYPVAFGTVNATGCSGDFWIGAIVLRFSPSSLIVDERDGIRVFVHHASDERWQAL